MKSYNPKSDLWSKIQQRRDFDSQVKEHVPNLPLKIPKADLWDAIEGKLDQRKTVIPLWKYGMVAASIALIFALSGIVYFELGEKEVEAPLITEVNLRSSEIETIDTEQEARNKAEKLKTEVSKPETPIISKPNQSSTQRETITPIETPELNLADLSFENTIVSELIIPPAAEVEAPQTLHKVRISWGMQEKSKLQTKFGSSSPEDISNQQLGLANQPKNSIKINFHKQ